MIGRLKYIDFMVDIHIFTIKKKTTTITWQLIIVVKQSKISDFDIKRNNISFSDLCVII
jgi:hypothetical protein